MARGGMYGERWQPAPVILVFLMCLFGLTGHPGATQAAESGFAGLQVQAADQSMRAALGAVEQRGGVMVRDLAPGGPGEAAGLRRGDLLLSYEGVALIGLEQLVAFMQGTLPGDGVRLGVWRQDREHAMTLSLGVWPPGWRVTGGAVAVVPSFGLTLKALTPNVRQAAHVRWGTVGVLVAAVEPASVAAAAGLRAGDVLVAVGRTRVFDPAEVEAVLRAAGDRWMALVDRGRDVLLLGPGAPEDVVAGEGLLVAVADDGPYVLDVALAGPDDVMPGDRVETLPAPITLPPPNEVAVPDAGLTVAALSAEARMEYGVRWSSRGAVITAVEATGRAGLAGLQPGHVVRSVNQSPVRGPEDVAAALTGTAAQTVLLVVERADGFSIVTLTPEGQGPAGAAPVPAFQWGVPKED